jgi:Tol biopolymer transport system component/DNA-binding winged helix-turn-helix (wHTH) protein
VDVQPNTEASQLNFGGFTLDLKRHGLYCRGERIHLTAKPLDTLIHLVTNHGRTIEKQELLNAVWKDTFVTEDTLVQAIREIRRALGDNKENPRFVQTIPRHGYRFVGDVSPHPADRATSPQPLTPVEPQLGMRRWFWIAPVLIFTLVLAWSFWPRASNVQIKPAGIPRADGIRRQITSGQFDSGKPSFSPDGKFILYVSSSEETRGYGDLFVRQFPDGAPVRITNNINPSGDLPVFTADGSHVVLSIPRIGSDGKRHHDLWMVPSFGGPPSRYVEDASGAGFSSDGKWVAYTKYLPTGNALWVSPVNNREEHLEVSAEGYTPRWSRSGDWLAYSTGDPNHGTGDIWICRLLQSKDGRPEVSDQKQITNENRQLYGLTWAADGRSIIFASKRAGSLQLYGVSIADGSIDPLLTGIGEYGAPSASADGSTVIFHHYRLVNDLMITTLGGNCEAKNLTYGEDQRWPRISPSGEKLVSVLRRVDDSERLYLTDLRNKQSYQLVDRVARHPCWVDEENAAFLSADPSSQDTEVVVVNTTTRETRAVAAFPGEANWLAIHPDGKRLAVVLKRDGRERIVLRNLTDHTDQTVQEGAEYEYLRWSPNGSSICWDRPGASQNAPHQSAGIWVLEIGQLEPRLIARDGYCPAWTDDGAAIYFAVRQGSKGLRRYDLATKKETVVCSWDTVFNYDARGSRLVFTHHRNDNQIYSVSLRP